jgi:hypothetical protein
MHLPDGNLINPLPGNEAGQVVKFRDAPSLCSNAFSPEARKGFNMNSAFVRNHSRLSANELSRE